MATVEIEYPQMGVRVIPGKARINAIDQIVDRPEVKIFNIDMNTKRAEPWVTQGDDGVEILLVTSSEDVKSIDENANEETRVFFDTSPEDNWYAMVDAGRYSIRLVMYKYSADTDRVYADVNM